MLLRRIAGKSMLPTLRPGRVIIARPYSGQDIKVGDVVIIAHNGLEKIKRLAGLRGKEIYVVGDNPDASTDSRHFGWLPREALTAIVVWPRKARRPPTPRRVMG